MKEVDPKSTSRALAFELWMKGPMSMSFQFHHTIPTEGYLRYL